MAVYLKARPKISDRAYNASLTDRKVDFILDEAKLERKVEVYEQVVLPVITYTEELSEVLESGQFHQDLLTPVTFDETVGAVAYDEQKGTFEPVVTSDFEDAIDGIYMIEYSAVDGADNETAETFTITTSTDVVRLNVLPAAEGDTGTLRFDKAAIDYIIANDTMLNAGNQTFKMKLAQAIEVIAELPEDNYTLDIVHSGGTVHNFGVSLVITLESMNPDTEMLETIGQSIVIDISAAIDTDYYGAAIVVEELAAVPTAVVPVTPQVVMQYMKGIQE